MFLLQNEMCLGSNQVFTVVRNFCGKEKCALCGIIYLWEGGTCLLRFIFLGSNNGFATA